MNDRNFLKTEFTPAEALSNVRKDVGGFLRYIQHRDHHAKAPAADRRLPVAGLLKYVAYRDRASYRAELFGPDGRAGAAERAAFTGFVIAALENSRPQMYLAWDGQLHDRRKAVHRMIISPERAEGLDLRGLTLAGTAYLDRSCGTGLRWMAAIHRNTDHHHIHFVPAGMRQAENGRFVRVDITKPRLAALKKSLLLEIERQRGERTPLLAAARVTIEEDETSDQPVQQSAWTRSTDVARLTVRRYDRHRPNHIRPTTASSSLIALRAVARRYQRRMQRELEDSHRQAQWDHVA